MATGTKKIELNATDDLLLCQQFLSFMDICFRHENISGIISRCLWYDDEDEITVVCRVEYFRIIYHS